MMSPRTIPACRYLIPAVLLAAALLAACAGGASGDPAAAVETYLSALAAQDLDGMIAASCADWEDDARAEYNSFAAVALTLEDAACQVSGEDGETQQVTCSGRLLASYNAENQAIPLEGRVYQVILEAGEWRLCGVE
jgi:hypothetical protein